MKRKQLLGFAVAGLLVLSGCQSKVQDDGKDVIASIQGKNIKNILSPWELFMLMTYGGYTARISTRIPCIR